MIFNREITNGSPPARRATSELFIRLRDTRAMRRFERQVVLITGGSSGIGYATAQAFLEEGARVAINGRNATRLKRAEASLRALGEVLTIRGDVAKASDARRLVSETTKGLGPIDVLVNNAGIYIYKSLVKKTEREYDQEMDINLKGTFLCSKYVLPGMVRRRRGVIVNVSSESALVASAGTAVYCASKAGMVLLTMDIALEHAKDGIRANAVCPGEVVTPMMERDAEASGLGFKEYYRRLVAPIPMHRAAKPEEIARVILFLASDDSSFMTGAAVTVDGGASIL